jgi:hypothetical protein
MVNMSTYAYGAMLAPGKADELRRFAAELTGPRKAEHEDYMTRYHLVKEYGWIQATPMGDMFLVYLEATGDFLAENRRFALSTHSHDVWFKERAEAIIGQDLNVPFPADFVEVLYEMNDVPASGGEKPIAIASMVQPGKSDALRRLSADLLGPRRGEFRVSHRRFGSVTENVYLEHTSQGDLTVYYAEVPDPARAFQQFGESRDAFDMWWKEQLLDITGIDYNEPLPGPLPEMILSTTIAAVGAIR